MKPAQKIQNAFQLVAMIHRLRDAATDIAQLIEQPGFDPQARLIVDELLSSKPGHFAMACGVAVSELRGPADKLAAQMEAVAASIPPTSLVSGARGPDWADMIATPILTLEQAKAFIRYLSKSNLLFHFEDSPESIIWCEPGRETAERCFTDAEVGPLKARVNELYSFSWGEHGCPIGYGLDFEQPGWREE